MHRSTTTQKITASPSDWRQLEFPSANGGCLATRKRWVSGNPQTVGVWQPNGGCLATPARSTNPRTGRQYRQVPRRPSAAARGRARAQWLLHDVRLGFSRKEKTGRKRHALHSLPPVSERKRHERKRRGILVSLSSSTLTGPWAGAPRSRTMAPITSAESRIPAGGSRP
jgi:hypothetical protein